MFIWYILPLGKYCHGHLGKQSIVNLSLVKLLPTRILLEYVFILILLPGWLLLVYCTGLVCRPTGPACPAGPDVFVDSVLNLTELPDCVDCEDCVDCVELPVDCVDCVEQLDD